MRATAKILSWQNCREMARKETNSSALSSFVSGLCYWISVMPAWVGRRTYCVISRGSLQVLTIRTLAFQLYYDICIACVPHQRVLVFFLNIFSVFIYFYYLFIYCWIIYAFLFVFFVNSVLLPSLCESLGTVLSTNSNCCVYLWSLLCRLQALGAYLGILHIRTYCCCCCCY